MRFNKMHYKVVSVIDDKFYSALTYGIVQEDFHVNYKIGEWALPIIKNSKLFVFSDLDKAERYCKSQFSQYAQIDNKIQIFSCEVLNPTTQGRMCGFAGGWAIHRFWEGETMYACPLLLDAVLCDAVKLIERVQDGQ